MQPASTPGSGNSKRGLAAILLGVVVAAGGFVALNPGLLPWMREEKSTILQRMWTVPPFEASDQTGAAVTNRTLGGHVWIADFIFTRCTTMCPLLTGRMTLLRRRIESPDLRFVSFSVDPGHDTPPVLEAYAAKWNGEERWRLLQLAPDKVEAFAQEMNAPLQQTTDIVNPIMHSNRFFLVDDKGWVRGVYDSESEEALQELVADAHNLLSKSGADPEAAVIAAGPSTAEHGMELYRTLGCVACHDNPKLAPNLAETATRRAKASGEITAADRAELRRSIVDPDAVRLEGYSTRMPSYNEYVQDSEVDALVAYIASLAGSVNVPQQPVSGTVAAAEKVVDPVCHMSIYAGTAASHTEHDGTTYYFCSELCHEKFTASPEQYLESGAGK